jgi:hypothetical protein
MFRASVKIGRAIEDAYGFLWGLDERDFSSNELVPVYEKTTLGPRGVGTVIREVVKTPFFTLEIISEIVEVKPNERLAYVFHSDRFSGELTYTFEAEGYATRVCQCHSISLRGFNRLLVPFVALFFPYMIDRRLRGIKKLLESEPR